MAASASAMSEMSWHYPWVFANPTCHTVDSEKRGCTTEPGQRGAGAFRGNPWASTWWQVIRAEWQQWWEGSGDFSQAHPEAPDGVSRQQNVCLLTDLGEWVGLAFLSSRPWEWVTGWFPRRVNLGGESCITGGFVFGIIYYICSTDTYGVSMLRYWGCAAGQSRQCFYLYRVFSFGDSDLYSHIYV